MGDAESFFKRAISHELKPTIVNKDSNFVVVTYWWGRGNLNKNTIRPCPEDYDDIVEWEGIKSYLLVDLKKKNPNATEADIRKEDIDEEVKAVMASYNTTWKAPIKFEAMIKKWEQSCSKHGCNFLAEEYSEFAVKGGYQHAINFKPYFIDLALQACYPRGVLYIDGDMLIKKYPGIFDIQEVDYMARGWNVDPRPRPQKLPCFDPYMFETSGGTMYFGNTYHGRLLLKYWQRETLKNPGKADDRILSLAVMKYNLLSDLSLIQLPIEYLWLDLHFDSMLLDGKYKGYVTKSHVTITHPECLTGEERAHGESGSTSSREPKGYSRAVYPYNICRTDESFYEYVYFDKESNMGAFKSYLQFLSKQKIIKLVKFGDRYGPHNSKAVENTELIKKIDLQVHDNIVIVSETDYDINNIHKVSSKSEIPAVILKYLLNKQHVVYAPPGTRSIRTVIGKAAQHELDFVTKNTSVSKARGKLEYTLKYDRKYPIYFGPNNKTLRHLLMMSSSLDDFEKIFNESYTFLTRIHCGWI